MDYGKLTTAELVEMVRALEQKNEALRTENRELNRALTYKRTGKRSLLDELRNREKVEELLAVGVSNGELYRSTANLYGNFQTFYANIFRAMNPAPVKNEKAGTEYIRYIPFEKACENDYEVYKSVLEQRVDIIYEGKGLLKCVNKIKPSKGE